MKQLSIPIGQTHRFRLSVSIPYCSNSTVLDMSIDTYLIDQYVQVNSYNRLLAEQWIIGDSNRYPLSTAICYEKYLSIPIAGNNRPPIGIGSYPLPIDLEPSVQGVVNIQSTVYTIAPYTPISTERRLNPPASDISRILPLFIPRASPASLRCYHTISCVCTCVALPTKNAVQQWFTHP